MLKQFIEKKAQDFAEKFDLFASSNEYPKVIPPVITVQILEQIKSFHSSSLQDFATLLRSEIEGRRKDLEKAFSAKGREGDIALLEAIAYNSALTDFLALLEK